MGNSLLDIIVFGRTAGKNAAEKSKSTVLSAPTLGHVYGFEKELDRAGIKTELVSPKLLPDYTRKVNQSK
jgi:succinate dehydrogenase / fumarate reductase flavoprotein subunit